MMCNPHPPTPIDPLSPLLFPTVAACLLHGGQAVFRPPFLFTRTKHLLLEMFFGSWKVAICVRVWEKEYISYP